MSVEETLAVIQASKALAAGRLPSVDPVNGWPEHTPVGQAKLVRRGQPAGGDPSVLEASPFAEEPPTTEHDRLRGLTYAEACSAEVPLQRELVEGIVDIGTVGLVAGLPFSRKTFAAHELAEKIAARSGLVFDRFPVLTGGPVIYVWQDDGTAKMLERIQAKAACHEYPDTLPIRYLLNEGIRLPDDLPALRDLIDRDEARFMVFDSVYNFLSPSVGLKEEGVAGVLAETKRELCDKTGATVCFVDHAPWPTEANRGQRRAYGSIFKTAAVRWTIHLEADPKDDTRLHIEASGNNVAGFRRTPATWNPVTLEIQLLDIQRADQDDLDQRVTKYLHDHPWATTTEITDTVTGRARNIRESLKRLEEAGTGHKATSRDLGRPGTGLRWNLAPPALQNAFKAVPIPGTTPDDPPTQSTSPSHPSHPRRGDGFGTD